MNKLLSTLFTCFLSIGSLYAHETIEDKTTKNTFLKNIAIDTRMKHYQLEATGTDSRSKYFVKVYSVAHYWENPIQGKRDELFQAILKDDKAKQFIFHWLYDIESRKLKDGFLESFHMLLTESQFRDMSPSIEKFVSFFNKDILVNDIHQISWIPGGTIDVIVNGERKGSIKNKEFAETLWSIWMGPKTSLNRNNLIKLYSQR